jgi:transmembrane sensor
MIPSIPRMWRHLAIILGRDTAPQSPPSLRLISRDPEPDPASDAPGLRDFHFLASTGAPSRGLVLSGIAALAAAAPCSWMWLSALHHQSTTHFASGPRPVTVLIADGSRCRLAPDTQIEMGKDPTALDLTLIVGAVLCDMAPNPIRNFTVYANGIRIKDIGTIFSVMRTMSGVKVTVVSGAVQYSPSVAAKSTLVKNQQAFITSDRSEIEKLSPAEMTLELSLEFGDLAWKRIGLVQAARVLNWYNRHDSVKIVVSPEVGNELIGGTIPHPEHPERFVKGYVGSHPEVVATTEVSSDRTTIITLHNKTP